MNSFPEQDVLKSNELTDKDSLPDGHVLEQEHPNLDLMPADHPLLSNAQEKLHQTLLDKSREIENLIRIQNEVLKRAERERESTGLELYSFQQRYQNLQKSIHQRANECETLSKKRVKLNENLQKLRTQVESKSEESKLAEKQRSSVQTSLNETFRSIRLLQMEKERVQNDLKVTKRIVSKAEEDLREKEQRKMMQDLIVDSLSQQADRLERESKLYEARLSRHKSEDEGVKQLISEATSEMEIISFEKKKVLSQWKSALATLERRDLQLQKLRKKIEISNELIKTLEIETKGYIAAIDEKLNSQEMIQGVQGNLKRQIANAQRQIEDLTDKKQKLAETFDILKKSAEFSEQELSSMQQKGRLLKMEGEAAIKQARAIAHEIQQMELETMREAVSRFSVKKIKELTLKDGVELRKKAQELELALNQLKADSAKAAMTNSEYERSNKELEISISDLSNQIIEENKKSSYYESETKRISVELTKRQNELETLNRKYDKIVSTLASQSGAIQGEIGPLEATIHNLKKGIQDLENESNELQQRWMRNQIDIVQHSKLIDELHNQLHENEMKKSVLERKMTLIDARYCEEEDEIKALKKSCSKIHSQMQRLNIFIVKHEETHAKVSDNTKELELSFKVRLRQSEKECMKLESIVEKIKQDVHTTTEKLIESERNVLLWKRKLQVVKENAEAVDPNFGGSEIKDLEYKLQKAKSKYVQLVKTQQLLLQDITASIERQTELNEINFSGRKFSGRGQVTHSQISDLRKRILQLEKLLKETDIEIVGAREKQRDIRENVEAMRQENWNAYDQRARSELRTKQLKKRQNLLEIAALQTKAKRYQDLINGKYVINVKDVVKMKQEINIQEMRYQDLQQIKCEMKEFIE